MVNQQHCCICGDTVEPPHNLLGGRVYCARHYAQINKPHTGFWRATVIQIIGMALFSAVVATIANFLPPLEMAPLIVLGLFLAIVPTALWLIYFYRQDRLEPEPKHKLGLVFLTALLLTDVLARRVIYDWFRVPEWAATNTWTSLSASIFISAAIYQLIVYIGIRMVYQSDEFDERMDGIVYGTVAGLGVATMLNLRYIIDNGGVELAPGVVRTVTTALAQASFGGLMGWFMAEAKFTHKKVWWVPAGFALSVLLNGVFSWLIGEVADAGLGVEVWRSLLFGLLVALGTFIVLALLMRRATEVTLRRTPASP
jgi:RsiW-degrading membrane proteinase PrsW (M82 family)